MMESGVLQGFKVGRNAGKGEWRIVDIGQRFEEYLESLENHLAHVPLLSTAEVAEVTGYSILYIQQLVKLKKIKPTRGFIKWHTGGSQQKMFTVAEVRKYLWAREKRQRQGRRIVKIERIVRWASTLMDEERKNTIAGTQVIDEIGEELEAILSLPNPERTHSLQELWWKLDGVSLMIQAARDCVSTESSTAEILSS